MSTGFCIFLCPSAAVHLQSAQLYLCLCIYTDSLLCPCPLKVTQTAGWEILGHQTGFFMKLCLVTDSSLFTDASANVNVWMYVLKHSQKKDQVQKKKSYERWHVTEKIFLKNSREKMAYRNN